MPLREKVTGSLQIVYRILLTEHGIAMASVCNALFVCDFKPLATLSLFECVWP